MAFHEQRMVNFLTFLAFDVAGPVALCLYVSFSKGLRLYFHAVVSTDILAGVSKRV